ncbi:alpha-d-galacturonidase [Anditalea andensis]|uniref:Beta-hexosaminidase bacterial type N-terminal domain-containing protein n=1 Tax=Anditalea andensis TaxID=1048983 RepID=A0A074LKE7_9BACT|nr:hypothetical protein [Anditalea andensis]KEO74302.1 hypothetical protein EL17_09225 [Anditalea andensis]
MKAHSLIAILFSILLYSCAQQESITVVTTGNASARTLFGTDRLVKELEDQGYQVNRKIIQEWEADDKSILIGEKDDPILMDWINNSNYSQALSSEPSKEGFQISSTDQTIVILGSDASGSLYGALEVGDRLRQHGSLDFNLNLVDQPEMVLRGTAIGMQKTTYLPGRGVYEYPYTPENFQWFYDKNLWIDYLDMLVENRMNSLYLWNGHPFASLVKLEDYPYAMEVSEEDFEKNQEMFHFLTEEAEKRGIWVIQMFYNIIVSKPFADHHNIKSQDRSRPITPLLADYTQKSIAAFIEKYPNVGLLVALGEAMQGEENDIKWFTETIIPGVKDGLKALGRTDEPPIILRAHDTNAPLVMEKALPLYNNLYTTHKYNGESLTTYEPRGPWSQIHRDLSSKGNIHISNVHILANLEPFRYGSPDFIQKSVLAMHEVHGANALHLYPQASYWDWPYTADNTNERLLQIDRDWIWYKAWARYAWKSQRDRNEEITYWSNKLSEVYDAGDAGHHILDAYEETGEIAPKLLRRFGITEGNRQTLLLGMFGSQLVNPYKWRVYPGFYESCGPVGEILIEYVKKEWNNEPHEGETPTQIIDEVVAHGRKAVEAIDQAADKVNANQEEFERLKNDVYCYNAFANFFSEKVKASHMVLRHQYSGDLEDLEKAIPHLEKSVDHYKQLVDLTKDTYLYANSMQTAQRRIPIGGDDGKHSTWIEMLPHYEKELMKFKRNVDLLKSSEDGKIERADVSAWTTTKVEWLDNISHSSFVLKEGQKVYTDESGRIEQIAEEIKGLNAVLLSSEKQKSEGTTLKFANQTPVKLVVGYFNSDQKEFSRAPDLETNAAGNLRGESEIKLANAMKIEGMPRVNIHTYSFEPGNNELILGKGKVMILGFIDGTQSIEYRDAGIIGKDEKEAIDWLFY